MYVQIDQLKHVQMSEPRGWKEKPCEMVELAVFKLWRGMSLISERLS